LPITGENYKSYKNKIKLL